MCGKSGLELARRLLGVRVNGRGFEKLLDKLFLKEWPTWTKAGVWETNELSPALAMDHSPRNLHYFHKVNGQRQPILGVPLDTGRVRTNDTYKHEVNITEASGGSLVAEMKVEEEHANLTGFLHGGVSTLLVDTLSGIALMTANPSLQNAGVSLNINMTFLNAAPVGQEIVIKASTDKVGARIAFLTVDILKKSTNEVIAKGSHTKFIGNSMTPIKS